MRIWYTYTLGVIKILLILQIKAKQAITKTVVMISRLLKAHRLSLPLLTKVYGKNFSVTGGDNDIKIDIDRKKSLPSRHILT